MIFTTKKSKTNKERTQDWRDRDKKQKQDGLEKVKQLTGWYEPVEQ